MNCDICGNEAGKEFFKQVSEFGMLCPECYLAWEDYNADLLEEKYNVN